MRGTTTMVLLLTLAACGSEPGPGGVTAGEAKALDEAAEMLEAQRLPESALKPAQQSPGSQSAPANAPAAN